MRLDDIMGMILSLIVSHKEIIIASTLVGFLVWSYNSKSTHIAELKGEVSSLHEQAEKDGEKIESYNEALKAQDMSYGNQISALTTEARRNRSEIARLERNRKKVRMSNEKVNCAMPDFLRDAIAGM